MFSVCGIDPGKKGALVAMCLDSGKPIEWLKMPLDSNRKVNVDSVYDFLTRNTVMHVAIETQQIRSGQRGSMAIGENFGRITGVVDLFLPLSTVFVTPQNWQGDLFGQGKYRKAIGVRHCVVRNMPIPPMGKTAKSKKPHDGVTDAWCIADWRRNAILSEMNALPTPLLQ